MLKIKITIFLCILCFLQSIKAQRSTNCKRSCGPHQVKDLPSPFGFSGDCQIPLNCSGAGEIFINEFKVQSFSSDKIMVNLPVSCSRPISSLRQLFGRNYAPTTHNGILLQNCTSPVTECLIPTTMIQTRFENTNCSNQEIWLVTSKYFYFWENLNISSFLRANLYITCILTIENIRDFISTNSTIVIEKSYKLDMFVYSVKCMP